MPEVKKAAVSLQNKAVCKALQGCRQQKAPGAAVKVLNFVNEQKYPVIGVFIFIGIWQVLCALQAFGENFSEAFSPVATFRALLEMYKDGELCRHAVPSLKRIFFGLSLSILVAVPVGIVIGYFKKIERLTSVVFQFMRMVSPLAWMPIAIIIFGVGNKSVIFLLWLVAIWPLILNTAHGASRVNTLWIDMARTMGGRDFQIVRKIVIPASIPDMLNGLRLSLGISWIILVPAEMLGVSEGLGYFILDTRDRFRYDQLMATIFIIGCIGFVLDSINRWLIRKYSWKM